MFLFVLRFSCHPKFRFWISGSGCCPNSLIYSSISSIMLFFAEKRTEKKAPLPRLPGNRMMNRCRLAKNKTAPTKMPTKKTIKTTSATFRKVNPFTWSSGSLGGFAFAYKNESVFFSSDTQFHGVFSGIGSVSYDVQWQCPKSSCLKWRRVEMRITSNLIHQINKSGFNAKQRAAIPNVTD